MLPRFFLLAFFLTHQWAQAALVPAHAAPRVPGSGPAVLVRWDSIGLSLGGEVTQKWYRLLRVGSRGNLRGLPELPVFSGTGRVRVLKAVLHADSGETPLRQISTPSQRIRFQNGPYPAGATVEVLLERRVRSALEGLDMAGRHYFGDHIPVGRDLFEVRVPRSVDLHYLARGMGERSEPVQSAEGPMDVYRWEVAEPRAGVALENRPSVRVSRLETWAQAASWYRSQWLPRLEVTAAVQQQAASLVSKLTTQEAKIVEILRFVSEEITYETQTKGSIADFTGEFPEAVLASRVGNCAGKSNLLVALLRSQGIRANPVLAATNPARPIDPEVPTFLPGDHAVVRIIHQGREFFCDPTEPGYLPGELPLRLRRALVWDPFSEQFIATPTGRDLMRRRAELTLNAQGELSGTYTIEFRGGPAARMRQAARRPQLKKSFPRLLPPGLHALSWELPENRASLEDPMRLKFRVQGKAAQVNGSLILPSLSPPVRKTNRGERVQGESIDEVRVSLPPGVRPQGLPPGHSYDRAGYTFRSTWRNRGGYLEYYSEFEGKGGPMPQPLIEAKRAAASRSVRLRIGS